MLAEEKSQAHFDEENITKEEQQKLAATASNYDDNITISEDLKIHPEEPNTLALKNNIFFRATIAILVATTVAGSIRLIWGLFESPSTSAPVVANNLNTESASEKIARLKAQYQQAKDEIDLQHQQKNSLPEKPDPDPSLEPKTLKAPNQNPTVPPPPPTTTQIQVVANQTTSKPRPKTASLPLTNTVRAISSHQQPDRSSRHKTNQVSLSNAIENINRQQTRVNPSIALLTGHQKNQHLILGGTKISATILAPVHYLESLGGTPIVVAIDDDLRERQNRLVSEKGSRFSLKVIISDRSVYVTEIYSLDTNKPVRLNTRVTLTKERSDRPLIAEVLNSSQTSLFINRLFTTALETGNSILRANNNHNNFDGYSYYDDYNSDPLGTGLSTLSRSVLKRSRSQEQRLDRQALESSKVYLIQKGTKINIYFLDSFSIEKPSKN